MTRPTYILTIFFLFASLYCLGQTKGNDITNDTTINIFNEKNYFLTFKIIGGHSDNESHVGTLTLTHQTNGKTIVLLHDTLQFFMPLLQFKDFNNDKIKDILILNSSSARSVWTHHLYIVDNEGKKIKRVIDFEDLYDPVLDTKNNIIISTAQYACRHYSFYRITSDAKLIDLGNAFEDCPSSDDKNSNSKFEDAIKKINGNTIEK